MSQLVLQPDATGGVDVHILDGIPNANWDGLDFSIGTYTPIKSALRGRALLRFDLGGLPAGAIVSDAALTLTATTGGNISGTATFSCYRLSRSDWTELGATWNKYDGANNWTTAGGDLSTTGGDTCSITLGGNLVFGALKQLVEFAIANVAGSLNLIVLGPELGSGNNFFFGRSSDTADTAAERPKLVVNYTLPTAIITHPGTAGRLQDLVGNLGA